MTDLRVERRPERIQKKKSFWEAYGANIATIAGMIAIAALLYVFLARNDFQFVIGSDAPAPASAAQSSQSIEQGSSDQPASRTIGPAMYNELTDEQRKTLEADEVRRTGAKPVQ